MKRTFIAILVLVGAGGLIALLNFHPKDGAVGAGSSAIASDPATPMPTQGGATTPAPTTAAATGFKDGTYTGTAIENAYGTVQVQAVVSGGKLAGVNFLQMPNDQEHSQEVTAGAEPLLRSEAISAQSAQIDTVSGATQDTEAFTESLQSALDQAKA